MARVGAVQIWPEWKPQTLTSAVTAFARSASWHTTHAPLPPSSRRSRFIVWPPASKIRAPTAVEPVNEIMSTFWERTSASPSSGEEPVTTFTTPGGKPTCWHRSANSMIASGSWGAGFMTIVLPVARAGPTFPAMLTSGKLYGEMHATTPTGWRSPSPPMSPPGASGVEGITDGGSGIERSSSAPRAYRSKRATAWGTCSAEPTFIVAPVSAMISGSRSSLRWRIASASADSSCARVSGEVRFQPGSASRAACAAASASAALASGAAPTTASVAGLTTS